MDIYYRYTGPGQQHIVKFMWKTRDGNVIVAETDGRIRLIQASEWLAHYTPYNTKEAPPSADDEASTNAR